MMKPKTSEDHQKFLKQRDFVPPCTNSGIFSAEEYAMLERHGHWLTALATGKIKPLTPAQERFLRVDQGKCEPETIFEIVWTRLKERQKWDEAEAEAEHYRVSSTNLAGSHACALRPLHAHAGETRLPHTEILDGESRRHAAKDRRGLQRRKTGLSRAAGKFSPQLKPVCRILHEFAIEMHRFISERV
jgi:uncharacterized protein YifE (UPF0438 family)